MSGLRRRRLLLALLLAGTATGTGAADLLRDEQGRAVSATQLSGRWLLVTFGYSRCPDVCPTTLHTIAAALARLGPAGKDVDTYFVTVDPVHDTPEVLRRFLAAHAPRVHGLTGSAAALEDARRTFGVPARHAGEGFDHGVFVYLVDPHGQVTDTFHPDMAPQPLVERLLARLTAR